MNENKYLKIAVMLLFAAFAAVSCWATAESLRLLLPSWPAAMCWIVTIGFFVIASYGTKLIVDSLNQNIYLEKRGLKLVGGIIIILVFWLFCSMPTNTHTFFYRSVIDTKVAQDISTTKGYLDQIRNNTVIEEKIHAKCNELENNINVKLGELNAEIMNDLNPGFGPKAKEIFSDFATLLGVARVDPINAHASTKQARQQLCQQYRDKIYTLMDMKKTNIRLEFMAPNRETYTSQAKTDYKNLEIVEEAIKAEEYDLNDPSDIKSINDMIGAGYATIKTYSQFVSFQSPEDQECYTAPNQVTQVKQMLSVIDVWRDFIDGKYAGQGFFFWVMISILVDVAAFIFFDMAFKKRDDE